MIFFKNIFKVKISIIILFLTCINYRSIKSKDLTIIGQVDFNGSLSRHSIGFTDCLKAKIDLNILPMGDSKISSEIKPLIISFEDKLAKVSFFVDWLFYLNSQLGKKLQESRLKIAYSMIESTQLPVSWVNRLNKYFDLVVVPDEFLVKVYKESGVIIPIFVLPLGIYIDEFLELKTKIYPNKKFVFGNTTRFMVHRKNHALLIEAFAQEFGNNDNVSLRLNGGGGEASSKKVLKNLKKQCLELNIKNVEITNDPLEWNQYISFLSSFDCFVNISNGEGYSITPREALAAGIPTIITDNTAHTTICKTNFVRPIPSIIKIPFLFLGKIEVGYAFDPSITEVRKALRDVYENYQIYLDKAQEGRNWVKQFRWSALQNKYLNLIKPKEIILGHKNIITDNFLMTDSVILFNKYNELLL